MELTSYDAVQARRKVSPLNPAQHPRKCDPFVRATAKYDRFLPFFDIASIILTLNHKKALNMTSPCLQESVKSRLTHTDIFIELKCGGSVRHGKD